jgi:hypothetical protein
VQNPVDVGTFEFGQPRMIEGVLHDAPLPYVQVKAKGTAEGLNFLLVGAGKFGPPAVIHGHDGERVRFKGTLIYRQDLRMIEMTYPETFQVLGETTATEKNPPFLSLGEGTFVGELVDTKCFFGVMRPATGKVHRACAIRCLSGGAPPGLLVRDAEGNAVVLLLAGRAGKKLDYDVELAARVVKVKGLLELHSGLPVLRTSQITLK